MKQAGSIIIYAVLAIAVLGILSGIGYRIRESGKESVRLEWEEANRIQREAEAKQAQEASKSLEGKREKAKVVYRTITNEVQKIVDRPVYVRECFDSDGMRLIAAAISGEGPAAPKSDAAVPKPTPAR